MPGRGCPRPDHQEAAQPSGSALARQPGNAPWETMTEPEEREGLRRLDFKGEASGRRVSRLWCFWDARVGVEGGVKTPASGRVGAATQDRTAHGRWTPGDEASAENKGV